ncbi:MAG: hypothetical protein M3290_06725 [Actinomycetota bacterium]|nr:hypothetical protein [Actinomycetota bacterium]
MKRRIGWIFCGVAIVTAVSVAAAAQTSPSVRCDGSFHLTRRFTRGRNTFVQEPAYAAGKLWLIENYFDHTGDLRQSLKSWDGMTWSTEPIPRPQDGQYYIRALDVTDDGVAWLAGSHQAAETRAIVLRWDGTSWQSTAVPALGPDSSLADIDMWSSQDGWAVGHYEAGEQESALTLRWNGSAWQHVDSPGNGAGELRSVSIASQDDVWAVPIGGRRRATIRWDGTTWTRYDLPRSRGRILQPFDVDAVRANRAWISGWWERRRTVGAVLAWDGSRWSARRSVNRRGLTFLLAIDGGPGGWAVGETRTKKDRSPVALRKVGGRWERTAVDDGVQRHLNGVVDVAGTAWATGGGASKKQGLYGVLAEACT